jgi:hypothetical protein
MQLNDIKEQLKERSLQIWAQIQESSLYSNLREKYEALSPSMQRLVNIGSIALVVLYLIYLPYGYISSSQTNLETYELNRDITHQLLEIKSLSAQIDQIAAGISSDQIRQRIEPMLEAKGVPPEQRGEFTEISEQSPERSTLANKLLVQQGLMVQLKKLNLTQVTDLTMMFSDIRIAKLVGIQIQASADNDHYYDVVYKLVNFSFPKGDEPPPERPGPGRKLPRSGGRK